MFLVSSYSLFYTFDILALNTQVYLYEFSFISFFNIQISTIELISIFIVGAAFIKSAQLGGHA